MMRRQAQITINKSNIDDPTRFKVLDLIRYTVENNLLLEDSLKHIKSNLEQQFSTKWQVAIGTQFTGYLNEKIFPIYIQTLTRGTTYLVYSRNESQKKRKQRTKEIQK